MRLKVVRGAGITRRLSRLKKLRVFFLRSGQASVNRSGKRIEIQLKDSRVPELNPVFSGSSSGGKVQGTLKRFFMHDEDIVLFGDYRSMQFGGRCSIEEMVLRPKEPTGAALVLSRTTGTCD